MEGYFKVPNKILDSLELNGSDKLVYMVLSRYSNNKTKRCFPSVTTISKKARLSRRTTCRSLANLEQLNLIKIEREHGSVNHYQLV